MQKDKHDKDDQLRGKLFESMLGEALGGEQIPDLSRRIGLELAAASTQQAGVAESITTSTSSAQSMSSGTNVPVKPAAPHRLSFQLFVVAAGLLLSFLSTFFFSKAFLGIGPHVQLRVISGEASYLANHLTQHFTAGDESGIDLTIGDRFVNDTSRPSSLYLKPLGTLVLSQNSTVEILSMNWTKKDSSLMLASLTVGAIAGGFTWNTFAGKYAQAGQSLTLVAADHLDVGKESAEELQKTIALLKLQNSDLELALQRRQLDESVTTDRSTADKSAAPDSKPDVTPEIKALFKDPDFGDALANVDWQTLGVNLNEMLPLIAKLAEAINEGEDIPVDIVGEIQKRNGDLLVIAKSIVDAKVPGAGLNGSFTHPSVVSNQIGAVLQAAGIGLDRAQQDSMERLRSTYAARDRSLRMVAEGRDLAVENLLEEADFKAEFYDQARSILNPEQRAILWNDATRGRTQLDPFDVSNTLGEFAKRMWVRDAPDLAARWSKQLRSELTLDAAGKQVLNRILTEYANGFPQSFWDLKPNALDKKKMMESSRIREALRRQVTMLRQILNTVPMTPQDREGLKKAMFVLVPYPR